MSGKHLFTMAVAAILTATGSLAQAGPIFPCGIFGLQCRFRPYTPAYVPYGTPVYASECSSCQPSYSACSSCTSGCNTCTSYRPCAASCSTQYVPRTVYRPTLVTTPMTAYRPVRTCDACGRSSVSLMPTTIYSRRLAMMPYTTYYRAYRGYACASACGCSSCGSACGASCGSACGARCSSGSCGSYSSSSCATGDCGTGIPAGSSMGVTPQPSLRPNYGASETNNATGEVIRSQSQKPAAEKESQQAEPQNKQDEGQPNAEPTGNNSSGPDLVDPDARVALITAVYNREWSHNALRPAVHQIVRPEPKLVTEEVNFDGWHEVRPHPSDR